jgi:hypothetical protein
MQQPSLTGEGTGPRRILLGLAAAVLLASTACSESGAPSRPTPASLAPVAATDCAELPDATVTGTLVGDVEIATHGAFCTIRGVVQGDVTLRDGATECDAPTAVDVVRGTVEGDIRALGGTCVMVFLRDGAIVGGDVIYQADGNLGFLGRSVGASVQGSVLLEGGLLWATGRSETNRIEGDLLCRGGEPKRGVGSGSVTNWDGAQDDLDGTIGGSFDC